MFYKRLSYSCYKIKISFILKIYGSRKFEVFLFVKHLYLLNFFINANTFLHSTLLKSHLHFHCPRFSVYHHRISFIFIFTRRKNSKSYGAKSGNVRKWLKLFQSCNGQIVGVSICTVN